jgi:hypothetical protein
MSYNILWQEMIFAGLNAPKRANWVTSKESASFGIICKNYICRATNIQGDTSNH